VALAPLVASLAVRLLLVAAPFTVGGALLLSRAGARSAHGGADPALEESDGDRDHHEDEQYIEPGLDGIPAREAD
jgi:hypothetical protein